MRAQPTEADKPDDTPPRAKPSLLIFPALRTFVEQTVARAIKEAEARWLASAPRYEGVWQAGSYSRGAFVTRGGSVWHCEAETTARPGDSPDWRLAVKKGADAGR